MVMSLEIQCIVQDTGKERHERIQRVGGTHSNGTPWSLSEDQAIAGIRSSEYSFWTKGGGERANVKIIDHRVRDYLRTDPDTTTKDNLLSLPRCP